MFSNVKDQPCYGNDSLPTAVIQQSAVIQALFNNIVLTEQALSSARGGNFELQRGNNSGTHNNLRFKLCRAKEKKQES